MATLEEEEQDEKTMTLTAFDSFLRDFIWQERRDFQDIENLRSCEKWLFWLSNYDAIGLVIGVACLQYSFWCDFDFAEHQEHNAKYAAFTTLEHWRG